MSSSEAPLDTITTSYMPEMMVSSTSAPETIRPRGGNGYTHQPGKHRRIPTLAPLTSMIVSPAPPVVFSAPAAALPSPVIPTQEVVATPSIKNKKWLMGIVITAAVLAVVVAVNIFIYFYYRIKKQQPMPTSDTRIQILPRPTFSALVSPDRASPPATTNKQSSPSAAMINKQSSVPQSGFSTQTPQAVLPAAPPQVITQRVAPKIQSPALKQREATRQQIIIPESIHIQRQQARPTKASLHSRFLKDVKPVPVIPPIQPYHFKS